MFVYVPERPFRRIHDLAESPERTTKKLAMVKFFARYCWPSLLLISLLPVQVFSRQSAPRSTREPATHNTQLPVALLQTSAPATFENSAAPIPAATNKVASKKAKPPAALPLTSALATVQKVADKIIRDTRFELEPAAQKPVLGMEVIRYNDLPLQHNEVAYAQTTATLPSDTGITFGLTSAAPLRIWVNRQLVYQQENKNVPLPVEHSYNRFHFDTSFTTSLRKGPNEILVRYAASATLPGIFLRPVQPNGDPVTTLKFTAPAPFSSAVSAWLLLGPVPVNASGALPEQGSAPYYTFSGQILNWQTPPQQTLLSLVIPKSATYQRDPYSDWNYSNGITLWSLQALTAMSGNKTYSDHVKQYIAFLLQHQDYFRYQYEQLSAFRGSVHRLFRLTMLDDSGAPGLPVTEEYALTKDANLKPMVLRIADYVLNKQMRLPDGTFCRPEPVDSTVWADDLFMSTPFLLRLTKATGDTKYRDEAARQVLLFHKYLHDPQTGLYQHGYFVQEKRPAVARWGRANGWITWATAELLNELPANHPSYKKILGIFRQHVTSLVKYQDQSGFWHQLPDRPDSYEETSCTAMFTLVIARGVRKGWLPAKYKVAAIKGWKAIESKIDPDGTVHGICRGTEIGETEQFYRDRPTIDHDPRGLGAVITAGIEMAQLK